MQRYSVYNGLLHGGGFHLLGVQLLAAGCCLVWGVVSTAALLLLLGTCIRFRMREHEELLGADYVEHNVHRHGLGITRAVSVLGSKHEDIVRGHVPVGKNKVRLLLCIC